MFKFQKMKQKCSKVINELTKLQTNVSKYKNVITSESNTSRDRYLFIPDAVTLFVICVFY